jgi:arylformamidase
MSLIDITFPLDETLPSYPGDPPFERWAYRHVGRDAYEASLLSFGSHAGTHLDAPQHFIPGGWDVARIPLDILVGPAQVLDLRHAERTLVRRHFSERNLAGVRRLLLRTSPFDEPRRGLVEEPATLSPEAAQYLVNELGLCLIGIDTLSIESAGEPDFPTHRLLLGATPPVIIVEGLDLSAAPEGDYRLSCLPTKLRGCDAAPVRAVLETT